MLASDVQATFEGEPAAKSYDEINFSYPGIFATIVLVKSILGLLFF